MSILSDPEKRKQHDMGFSADDMQNGMGAGGFGGMPGGMQFSFNGMPSGGGGGMAFDPNDLFKMFMGQQMGGMDDSSFASFMGGGGRGGTSPFGGMGGFQQQRRSTGGRGGRGGGSQ